MEREIKVLLQFSSLRRTEYKIFNQKIDIQKLINEKIKLAEPSQRIGRNRVLYSHDGYKYLYTDAYYLGHVIDNLLSNAHKFCKNGTIKIRTHTTPSQFKFVITDTGIGIEAEKLNQIFQRHYQVEQSQKLGNTADGLGLTLVKEWVTLLGGEIQVDSTKDLQTTFIVILPNLKKPTITH